MQALRTYKLTLVLHVAHMRSEEVLKPISLSAHLFLGLKFD